MIDVAELIIIRGNSGSGKTTLASLEKMPCVDGEMKKIILILLMRLKLTQR